MKKKQHIVSRVLTGSIAEELGVEPGDCLVSINDTPVEDVFDYHYLKQRRVSDGSDPEAIRRRMGIGNRERI